MSTKKNKSLSNPDGDDPAHTPTGDNAGYRVGYRHPPRETRFQPGKSGNLSGRPKGKAKREPESLRDMIVRELASLLHLPDGTKLRKKEVLVRTLCGRALKGDQAALKQVISILEGSTRRGLSEKDVNERVRQKLREIEELRAAEIDKGGDEFVNMMLAMADRMEKE